jgi:hypothetical protein
MINMTRQEAELLVGRIYLFVIAAVRSDTSQNNADTLDLINHREALVDFLVKQFRA